MPKLKFTDLTIQSLKEGLYFDEKTPGFGIRIGKHRRTWLVLKGARSLKVRLGHYPALSLAEARKKALVALGSPYEPSHAPTFPEARAEYLAQGNWRPRSRYEITRTLNRHFDWSKQIDKITHRDVAEAIDKIEAKSEAAHAFKDIRAFFNWTIPRYLKSSPCTGLKPPSRYVPRSRVLSDDELVRVWKTAETMGQFGVIIQILICTGLRVGEATKIQRDWLKDQCLVIPASVAKNGKEHSIPLRVCATGLLKDMSTRSTISSTSLGKQKRRLDESSGVTDWTIHDLRRTYATNMQRLGIRLEVTEKLLNHVSGSQAGIVGIYQRHTFWDEMVEAVAKYENWLQTLIA